MKEVEMAAKKKKTKQKNTERSLTQAKQKAVKDLEEFLRNPSSIIYLRLLVDNERAISLPEERYWLILGKDGDGHGQVHVLVNHREHPLQSISGGVHLYSKNIGEFVSFKEQLPLGTSDFPLSVENAIETIGENGVIPLDGVVDWICERLVSE